MATNYTTNYDLCQWESTDQVLRTDFNADNAKIDAALFTLDSVMVKLCTGTYVGDGDESRTVSVPFPPRAVFLCTQYGETYRDIGSGHVYGGLALAGHPLRHKNCDALVISDTGFTVYHYSIDNLSALQMNLDGGDVSVYCRRVRIQKEDPGPNWSGVLGGLSRNLETLVRVEINRPQ